MQRSEIHVRSPKRGKESRTGRASWYDYYAGYSTTFAEDALRYAQPPHFARILDPWNGSGTTTDIAATEGFEAIGFDLNPVMVVVAKARLLDDAVRASLSSILDDLLLKGLQGEDLQGTEPLEDWFTPITAADLRRFERAIQKLLIDPRRHRPLFAEPTLKHLSSLASFFYIAAFNVLRGLLKGFRSTNPTWLRQPAPHERVHVSTAVLHELLRQQIDSMAAHLTPTLPRRSATIDRASSVALPITDGSIDVIIGSPPYCTRIDYVKKTIPELAFLGASRITTAQLRDQMIGTPTISKQTPRADPMWGPTCISLTETIAQHSSYASKSYYWKTYMQYFNGLYESLRDLNRTLKTAGLCLLVVQDSYYKDAHIDLAMIIKEMTEPFGWQSIARANFPTIRNIVGLNSRAIAHGNPRVATETVLAFRKEP